MVGFKNNPEFDILICVISISNVIFNSKRSILDVILSKNNRVYLFENNTFCSTKPYVN